MTKSITPVRGERIIRAILVLRGQRVILDRDLAAIYGVSTGRLNEAVKRNAERFPEDFMFRLSRAEHAGLISQIAISKPGRGGRRKLPWAFTEHGAIQAANVLNSPRAIAMGVYVVRAFVQLREVLAANKDLARKLVALERSLLALDLRTQRRFKEVYETIRALMDTPAPKRRGIGFTADLDEK
ncbi:MAG TPA: ORF6N domain-containing protein [Steroidobacteraceae bacterium]|nr:ORF6N domain-containing protein [Steroidobacteraceae bacterium]